MRRNRSAALIIGFALLFCFLGRGLKLTNEPAFCAKCHIIEPFYYSLARFSSCAPGRRVC